MTPPSAPPQLAPPPDPRPSGGASIADGRSPGVGRRSELPVDAPEPASTPERDEAATTGAARPWPTNAGLAYLLNDHFATGRRLAGVAGVVGTVTVQIAAHTGGLSVDNLRFFEVVGIYGLFWSLVVCVVPWERYGTNWIAFISLASSVLIFATVQATAVGADTTWVYHFFIVLLNSFYFPRRVAFLLLPVTIALSALPPWLDGDTVGAVQQLVIVAPVYATITLIGTTLIAKLIQALYAKIGEEDARRRLEEAELRGRQLEAIQGVIQRLNGLIDLDAIVGAVAEGTPGAIAHDRCRVFLRHGDDLILANGQDLPHAAAAPSRGLARWVAGQAETIAIGDAARDPRTASSFAPLPEPYSLLAAPLRHDDRPLGAIVLLRSGRDAFSGGDRRLLTIIAGQTATAVANAHRHEATRRAADTDGLTGLLNHRAILDRLEEALDGASKDHPVSVVMVDLNTFKRINDTYGHPIGNEVLRAVGANLAAACRSEDAVGRYGGDEFLVVLPDTPSRRAEATVRRLDGTLAAAPQTTPHGVAIVPRASIGIASAPEDGTTADALVAAADRRLYQAKGRTAGAPPAPSPNDEPEPHLAPRIPVEITSA